jgi:glycerophosphoryl diester phosphodiesterase
MRLNLFKKVQTAASFKARILVFIMAGVIVASCSSQLPHFAKPIDANDGFIVIAHRGASGYLPEHTIEAAQLAIEQGAHYIEQDLVLTSDDILVVLHDIHIETVTNVEDVFPSRARKDDRYYAIDFTLAELKQLSVHERQNKQQKQVYPDRYSGNGTFRIATFDEHIKLVSKHNKTKHAFVGIYPEIKAPEWHLSQGKDIALALFDTLEKYQLNRSDANIYVQSFEPRSLQYLKNELGLNVKLVQLIGENNWAESSADYDYLKSEAGLAFIATYAQGIGPWMPQLYDFDSSFMHPLAEHAKKVGLAIHPYTFRKDALPDGYSAARVMKIIHNDIQVDGIFTDHTDTVLSWLEANRAD